MDIPSYPLRGSVYWVDLDPTRGAEIRKTRPCLILTSNILNQRRRTVVVVPLSTTSPLNYPLHVPLSGIGNGSQAVIDQLRAVDKSRVGKWIGDVPAPEMERILDAVRMILELD